MLLAVAGMDQSSVSRHIDVLASGDWSRFSPADQVALRFARNSNNHPKVPDRDYHELVRHFGKERALDLTWWICHCHYMTRVADAFQLPLEHGNVFDGFAAEADRPPAPQNK